MTSISPESLGDRMKRQYEDRTRVHLPRRTFTIIRVDGKAFHSYTRKAAKPYDFRLMDSMDVAAVALCSEIQGCVCAYGQSDEYSFLLTDFTSETTEAWFDGNIQKMTSVAAATFSIAFYQARVTYDDDRRPAAFDARVFTIPDRIEVENYFIWRQQDAIRNAILMAGHAEFSPKQMHGLSVDHIRQKLLSDRRIDFEEYPVCAKYGRVIWKEKYDIDGEHGPVQRSRWATDNSMPVLTQCREYFRARMQIPEYPS